jgi:hypothetical protein
VVRTTGLEQRLVDTSTTSNDTNGRARASANSLLRTRRETNASLVIVGGVSNNSGICARCSCKRTTVTSFLLNVANNSTFREAANGENIADGEGGLLAAVDESTSVGSLSCDEGFGPELVSVGVTEDDTGKGSTTNEKSSIPRFRQQESTNRPESWMISFTTPRIYPFRSAKSSARRRAGFLLWWVWALN